MSIDWITVAAQIVNFLVLIWLLKKFLYRPILDGIDAREAEISDRMAEALRARAKAEAEEAAYHRQLESFQASKSTMASSARQAADAERAALEADTRAQLEQERKSWGAHLEEESRKYIANLHQAGAEVVLSLTRKILTDLAGETLEERIVAHFAPRLRSMAEDLRRAAGDDTEAVVITRDPLPSGARDQLQKDLQDVIPNVSLRFVTDAAQAPGLTLRMGSAQVVWTVDSYIDDLDALLKEQLATGAGSKVQDDAR